jgi:hypothetical protein
MAAVDHPSLDISMLSGGTIGTRAWEEAITAVIRRLNPIRSGYATPLALKVVFRIPGEVLRPDFTGLRTGLFSRRKGRLVIQVAVPEVPDGDPQAWVIAMLGAAVAEAERFAAMEALPDKDLSGLKRLVDAVADSPPR